MIPTAEASARDKPASVSHAVAPVVVTAPRPKWTTDAPLRAGMVDVQNALLAQYFASCSQGPTRVEFVKLADHLDRQSARMGSESQVAGPSRVRLQAMIVHLNRGSVLLRSISDQKAGVAEVVAVLGAYATDFDHPAWRPRRAASVDRASTEPDGLGGMAADAPEVAQARETRHRLCGEIAAGKFPFYLR